MSPRPVLRLRGTLERPIYRNTFRRRVSTNSNGPNPADAAAAQSKAQSRIERINARLPKFLRRYTVPLANAPLSHITSFLLLHEITAVVPLLSLFALFHYSNWLPPYISEGAWVKEGIEKFGRYFRRKGWLGEEGESKRDRGLTAGEKGVRVLVEVATAYAVTKALLPVRLLLSVWATPWFARIAVLPVTGWVGRLFGRGRVTASGAAGTGAVGAGALPKKVDTTSGARKSS